MKNDVFSWQIFKDDCVRIAREAGFEELLKTFLKQHQKWRIRRCDLALGAFEILHAKLSELEYKEWVKGGCQEDTSDPTDFVQLKSSETQK